MMQLIRGILMVVLVLLCVLQKLQSWGPTPRTFEWKDSQDGTHIRVRCFGPAHYPPIMHFLIYDKNKSSTKLQGLTLASGRVGVDAPLPQFFFVGSDKATPFFSTWWGILNLCNLCQIKLTGSCQVTELWRHKGNNVRSFMREMTGYGRFEGNIDHDEAFLIILIQI